MIVKIRPAQDPPTKLADAELWFEEGPLSGLRLIGFAIWRSRAAGNRSVTFPAKAFSIHGERRSYALLRPVDDDMAAADALRRLILAAYEAFEHRSEVDPDFEHRS